VHKSVKEVTHRLSTTKAKLADLRQRSDAQASELERLHAVVAEHERVRARDAELRTAASFRRTSGSGALSRDLAASGDGIWAEGSSEITRQSSAARGRASAGAEPHRMTLEGMFDSVVSAGLHTRVHYVAGVAFPAAVYSLVATLQFVSDQELRSPTPDGMRAAGALPLSLHMRSPHGHQKCTDCDDEGQIQSVLLEALNDIASQASNSQVSQHDSSPGALQYPCWKARPARRSCCWNHTQQIVPVLHQLAIPDYSGVLVVDR
jgi:hypothetical protein